MEALLLPPPPTPCVALSLPGATSEWNVLPWLWL
jgi:hypothetical protein